MKVNSPRMNTFMRIQAPTSGVSRSAPEHTPPQYRARDEYRNSKRSGKSGLHFQNCPVNQKAWNYSQDAFFKACFFKV